jgi:5-methylcytosine-specific restriction endonuclease McrA
MRECKLCGYTIPTALQRHHIRARAKDGDNKPSNLVTICSNCHTVLTSTMGKLNGETPSPRDVYRVAKILRKYATIIKEQQKAMSGVKT